MDFFSSVVNVSFVAAIIVIIQTVKEILNRKGIIVSSDTWKIVVLLLGIPMGIVMQVIDGWPGKLPAEIIMNLLVKCFIYSAAATLLYQTGKLTLDKLTVNKEDKAG